MFLKKKFIQNLKLKKISKNWDEQKIMTIDQKNKNKRKEKMDTRPISSKKIQSWKKEKWWH